MNVVQILLNVVQISASLARVDTIDRRQRLRARLLDAAERRIEAAGQGALRARDLAQDAGCSLGAIYNVFPDLDALILVVNGRTLARLDAELRAASAAEPPDAATPSERAIGRMAALATAYLEFAIAHRRLWRALFDHRMAGGRPVPEGYLAEQMRLFVHIVEPLQVLQPGLDSPARMMLARTLFSAAHGAVAVGLEEKLTAVPLPELRRQVALLAQTLGRGLGHPVPAATAPTGRRAAPPKAARRGID